MSGSYTQKLLTVQFTLGTGTFGETGQNILTISGLRVSATVVKSGGAALGSAQIRIFGMTQSQMNQLSTLGLLITQVRRNTVTLMAGDAISGMSQVFTGTIVNAWSDYQGAPQVSFNVEAYAAYLDAIKPVAPTSYPPGGTDVATIMAGLATQMGLQFENNGVSAKLASPYFPGTAKDQAQRCADAANINWVIDNGVFAIWPKNAVRSGSAVVISPETGLVGYPIFDSMGVILRTLFNPLIRYGCLVQVDSSLTPANGVWSVYALTYDLSCMTPGGPWFNTMKTARQGSIPVA